MPLFYQHNINADTKVAIWNIAESESFFLVKVPLPGLITHWHKRLQHLAGRYLLQELFPDFPYHLIEIASTRKPYLINEEYHFSISHCGDYAAVIVSRNKRVGIDIELVTPKIEKIKHKFLNENELDKFAVTDIEVLTLFWSAKEAVFKWYGNGGVDFRKHIDIRLLNNSSAAGITSIEFLKEGSIYLDVNYQFFNALCLAWITS